LGSSSSFLPISLLPSSSSFKIEFFPKLKIWILLSSLLQSISIRIRILIHPSIHFNFESKFEGSKFWNLMGSKFWAFCACFGIGCRLLLCWWLQFLAFVGRCFWFSAVGLAVLFFVLRWCWCWFFVMEFEWIVFWNFGDEMLRLDYVFVLFSYMWWINEWILVEWRIGF